MAIFTVFTLEASEISISGGAVLSGFSQGDGSHLVGETITLNSNAWVQVDITDNDANFNDSENGQNLDGTTSYGTLSGLSGNERVEAEYTLTVEDPDGNSYTIIGFNINEPGVTSFSTVEGIAFIGEFPPQGVLLTVVAASEGPSDSSTPYSAYATPPCFTSGTMIETPSGMRRIEDIAVGDVVCTLDSGAKPVNWVGRTELSALDLADQPRLRPVFIAKDAIAPGEPARDMLVSPQHRILLGGVDVELMFARDEVLVAAIHLVNGHSIRQIDGQDGVDYMHLAFDQHEVVMSDGLPTESFFPGATVLNGFDAAVRAELETLFPGCSKDKGSEAARTCLTGREAQVLLAVA
ncbi:MAG: Hint domain-containing protein [Litoreibacter sp.]|uniref:Hint domain-containing protein n=1 Tax=Litoreibacter sp. TaxID=1969459 RepID=UPI003298732C